MRIVKGAIDNPVEKTRKDEYFIRYSPYEDDKRVDRNNKKLLPGTYATTYMDSLICKDDSSCIIERYALPKEEKVRWKFHVKTVDNIDIQRGIVEPAFGKQGGGSEVFFRDGTNNGSLINSEEL